MKILRIFLAWWYWITNVNNRLARKRLKICVGCEFKIGMICGHCGCVLQAKARLTDEKCPVGKWEQPTIQKARNKKASVPR